ncbi:hypothetical protein ACFC0D_18570 [Streptomyces sp. NPDC056222]|uniref:hypothetical protein n=1 Tax=Streptomyces sp. NPDC056222 TaxID=3345749 RepID=UPI0035DE2F2E
MTTNAVTGVGSADVHVARARTRAVRRGGRGLPSTRDHRPPHRDPSITAIAVGSSDFLVARALADVAPLCR